MKRTLGIFLICLSFSSANAQKATELKEYMKQASSSESIRIVELTSKIQPTVYYERGKEKVFGNTSPTVVVSDVHSAASLARIGESFKDIELIEIRFKDRVEISSFNSNLDIFKNATNLKALLIRTEFPFTESEFENLFQNQSNLNLTLLYEVSIPQ